MLLHFWARQNPVSVTAECAKVAPNTAVVYVYQWLREVCSTRLINDGPVILGGPPDRRVPVQTQAKGPYCSKGEVIRFIYISFLQNHEN